VFTYFGDIGGLFELLRIIGCFLVQHFSDFRMKALLSNKLFHGSHTTFSDLKEDSNKINKRKNGDLVINVPSLLDWELLIAKLFCCCKTRQFKQYSKVLDLGYSQF
jgi:hypothetical protein